MCWEGDHVRLVLIRLTKALVGEVSSSCVLGRLDVDVFWMSRLETNVF